MAIDPDEFAKRINKQLAGLEKLGVLASRREFVKLRARVLAAYQRGQKIDITSALISHLVPMTADVSTYLHVQGQHAAEQLAKGDLPTVAQTVATPSALDKALARLGDSNVVDALHARYQTQALRIVKGAADGIEDKLRKKVADLIATGTPTRRGVKELSTAFDELGITQKSGYQLETIFRTQTHIAYNAGRWQADQDPDIQNVLWGYTYATIGDDRVRPTHEALDNTTLPKDDPMWKTIWPPNGWRCRCIAIPVFAPVKIVRPKPLLEDGTIVGPDKGFTLNFGIAIAA